MRSPPPVRPRPPAGFTLVEIIVAMSIIALLLSILIAWGASSIKAARIRRTQVVMNNVLAMTQLLTHKSLVMPDHRLANFYWIQPHTAAAGTAPTWDGRTDARPLSSAEFLVFLASQVSLTGTMLETLGPDHLKGTSVPAGWPTNAGGVPLVDVFEKNPSQPLALGKDRNSADFHLASDPNGYRLRGIVDAWGNEMAYRFTTHRDILNLPDTETVAPPLNQKIREKVDQDEAVTRARYAALGRPADASTEYVRPAMAGYFSPVLVSSGPDGLWGAFTDGAPPERNPQASDRNTARDLDARDNLYSVEEGH